MQDTGLLRYIHVWNLRLKRIAIFQIPSQRFMSLISGLSFSQNCYALLRDMPEKSINWRDSLHFSILNAAYPTCETV